MRDLIEIQTLPIHSYPKIIIQARKAMIKTHIGINTIDFFTTLIWYHSNHD